MSENNFRTALEALERQVQAEVERVPTDVWDRLSMLATAMSGLRALSGEEAGMYEIRPGVVLMNPSSVKPASFGDPAAQLKPDAFFRHTPAQAAKKYLRLYQHAKHLDDIFAALVSHGFEIEGKDDKEKRRSLYVSLVRNTAEFALVSRLTFGLVEFYPDVKAERSGKKRIGKDSAEPEANDTPEDEEESETGNS